MILMRGKDSYFVYLLFENYGKIYCDNNYSLEYCFMRNRLNQFMTGRYGNDPLNRFLSIAVLVLIVVNLVLSRWLPALVTTLIFWLSLIGLVIVYVRMLSRNFPKRRKENQKYMQAQYKVTSFFKLMKERWAQRKDYKFFRCPACHTILRVPRGKGKINIVCKKCGNSFQGKT